MKFRFNRFSETRAFRSRQELSEFANSEAQKFQALNNTNHSAYNQWGHYFFNSWTNLSRIALDENISDNGLNQIDSNPYCFEFESPVINQFIFYSNNNLTIRMRGALSYLSSSTDNQHSPGNGMFAGSADMAAILATQHRIGRSSTGKMLSQLIDEHESRLSTIFDRDRSLMESKVADFENLSEEYKSAIENHKLESSDFIEDVKARWAEAYENFIEKLKTETAVKLWDDRAEIHKERYRSFRTSASLIGTAGLFIGFSWILFGFRLVECAVKSNTTGQIATYATGSVLLFTLLVWTLRVVIRSMISEDHLATDAAARSAMAHTYLALTKEERAEPEDRAIVLAALFTPVSDGLVKDDGMPMLSPTAIAAAAITNPK